MKFKFYVDSAYSSVVITPSIVFCHKKSKSHIYFHYSHEIIVAWGIWTLVIGIK